VPTREQQQKVEEFEKYNFEPRTSRDPAPRFHDNDVRTIKVTPPAKKNDPAAVELIFFDRNEGVERVLSVKGCANLRFSMDFDILADNTSSPTSSAGQTSNVELNVCRECLERALKRGIEDWNVEYRAGRDTPASYRLYRLHEFILVKVWLHGGTLEIVARDIDIETRGVSRKSK
jgi:hypothetical protein